MSTDEIVARMMQPSLVESGSDQRSWEEIRGDFPILEQTVNNNRLAYLDSAASSQMPKPVLDALVLYHTTMHANVHRGVHTLSQRATDAYEAAREKIAQFLGAKESRECIFVRGTTEGANLVAYSFGEAFLQEGDEVIVTAMEHHANIVPWQMLRERKGIVLRVVPMTDDGELIMDEFDTMLNERTKLVSVMHVSNVFGTVNPIEEIIEKAHARDIPVMVDGSQAAPHMPVDVTALDVDFYLITGHKLCGPTGIGVLYGKAKWLEQMPPFLGGGDMIDTVTWERSTYDEIPGKFEAGTPSIAAAIGLGAALDYLTGIGMTRIQERDEHLLDLATQRFEDEIKGATIYGKAKDKTSVLSFGIEGVHPHDIGTILDAQGIAVRTGQHCAEPAMTRLGIMGTARASFAFYNDEQDIAQWIEGLVFVGEIFGEEGRR